MDSVDTSRVKEEQPINIVRSQIERMEKSTPVVASNSSGQWRPNPPPAPVAPQHLEKQAPQPPSRSSSFYSARLVPTSDWQILNKTAKF